MWIIWKFFIFVLLLLGVLTQAYEHPKGYKRSTRNVTSTIAGVDPSLIWIINDEEIYVSSIKTTIENAMTICIDLGMVLISIETPEKNEAIYDFLYEYESETGWVYWTSGRRINGDYQWTSTGKMFTFDDFTGGDDQPELKDCCIEYDLVFEWWRADCTLSKKFLCQLMQE